MVILGFPLAEMRETGLDCTFQSDRVETTSTTSNASVLTPIPADAILSKTNPHNLP